MLHAFPLFGATVLVLFTCMFAAFGTVASTPEQQSARLKLAFVGSAEDSYFQSGLEVVQAYDSSRFAVETFQMNEQEALQALQNGKIDAYVVIPDDYIKEAMAGRIGSLRYVSTTGAADLTTLFKEEITKVVSDIIMACEKAMYGADSAAQEMNVSNRSGSFSYDISLTYVDYILNRTDTYNVHVLGIDDALGLDGYLFTGITILLIALAFISVSAVYIKKDFEFERLMASKGIGATAQTVVEYFLLFVACGIIVFTISLLLNLFEPVFPLAFHRYTNMLSFKYFSEILAVILVLSSFSYLLFQFSNEFVSGILLQFFGGLVLCFISGCLYPAYFFPEPIYKLSSVLPHGLARSLLTSCLTGESTAAGILPVVAYSVMFIITSILIRYLQLKKLQR